MSKVLSKVRNHANGRELARRGALNIDLDQAKPTLDDLEHVGLGLAAMDSALIGPATQSGPLTGHFLETWLPGILRVITQVRNLDEIVGITQVGRWEDETINLRTLEPTAKPELYGDNTNIPLADYLPNTEQRGIVRFEQGFQVGKLEERRQSAEGFQAADEKRRAAAEGLDRVRNEVGFKGFLSSDGTNVYGLLNDPGLPAYMNYDDATVGGGTAWLTASFANLVKDFTRMVSAIEGQFGGNLSDNAQFVLVMPTGYRSVLLTRETNTTVSFGEWLRQNFPNIRIVYSPEFLDANGGKDVAYLFVDNAGNFDDSDFTAATMIQAVPVQYQVLGSENRIKGYIEDAINATAGVIVLRPWAFARYSVSAA